MSKRKLDPEVERACAILFNKGQMRLPEPIEDCCCCCDDGGATERDDGRLWCDCCWKLHQVSLPAVSGSPTFFFREMHHLGSHDFVYFVQAGDGLIKIGTSTNVPFRVWSLEKEYGKLEILAVVKGGKKLERQMHRIFQHLRVTEGRGRSREWFRPGRDLLDYVESIVNT